MITGRLLAVEEMSSWCFNDARDDPRVGVVVLTGLPMQLINASLWAWHFTLSMRFITCSSSALVAHMHMWALAPAQQLCA